MNAAHILIVEDDLFEALVMQRGRLKNMQQLLEWWVISFTLFKEWNSIEKTKGEVVVEKDNTDIRYRIIELLSYWNGLAISTQLMHQLIRHTW